MSKSCWIIPRIKNKKGELVESKLFKDLSKIISNRKTLVDTYFATKHPLFIEEAARYKKDTNGEILISELLNHFNLEENINEYSYIEYLNRSIGHYIDGKDEIDKMPLDYDSYSYFMDKAIAFNSNPDNKGYIADVVEKDGEVYIEVFKESKKLKESVLQKTKNYNLNERLREILENNGIAVGILERSEERLSNGITDVNSAAKLANGLIQVIKVARGEKGVNALPEEFAHISLNMLEGNVLVNRLYNHLKTTGLYTAILGEEYEQYRQQYDNNEDLLVREAAGKLLAKHLANPSYSSKVNKSLIKRVIDNFKNFFGSWNEQEIYDAIEEADEYASTIAKNLLHHSLLNQGSLSNIIVDTPMHQLKKRVITAKELLNKIIGIETKRYNMFASRKTDKSEDFATKQADKIAQLESHLMQNTDLLGIAYFLETALKTLNSLKARVDSFEDLELSSVDDFNNVAKVFRDIRNYIFSFKGLSYEIQNVLDNGNYKEDSNLTEMKKNLKDFQLLLLNIEENYKSAVQPLIEEFFRPYLDYEIKNPFSDKSETKTIGQMLWLVDNDISFFDRWLDSMADSRSAILRIIDDVVKKRKEEARYRTLKIRKRIEAIQAEARKNGITDFEWMFEKDSNGHKTGWYIQEKDWARYREEKEKIINSLKSKYGDDIDRITNSKDYKEETSKLWNGNEMVFDNPVYKNLNFAQKKFYHEMIAIKEELDNYLPDSYVYTDKGHKKTANAVKIRKDTLEQFKSKGLSGVWQSMKDKVIRRSDDTELDDEVYTDFEGRPFRNLPIFFTSMNKNENTDDLSTDVPSTMLAYAAMAIDYNEMNRVIHILELGKDSFTDWLEIKESRGGKHIKEKNKGLASEHEEWVKKDPKSRYIIQRLNDYFTMQVYQRYMADEGTVGKFDVAKTADTLGAITAINSLGLNVLAGFANVATGKVMMRIESIASEFFSEKDTLKADAIYGKNLGAFLKEVGNRVKTSKLYLFDELFNVLQDFEGVTRDAQYERAGLFARMFGTDALFLLNNAGEHWMANRTALALAQRFRLKKKGDTSGETISLWDALEVKYTDPNNKHAGAELVIKEGYVKEDGTEFTKEDIANFSRRSAAINQSMHGIYNKLDRNAFQRLAIGRLAMMFRKWMKPSFNRRWGYAKYNYDKQTYTEGYYKTYLRFLNQLRKDLIKGQIHLYINTNNMTPEEKANVIRARTELAHYALILGALAMLGALGYDDKDKYRKKNWFLNMVEYQMKRLRTEIGSQTITPAMPTEFLRIADDPMAATTTLQNVVGLIDIVNPFSYETFGGEGAILKSGQYKGHNKAYRALMRSPLGIFTPENKQIYRAAHPEEAVSFFQGLIGK